MRFNAKTLSGQMLPSRAGLDMPDRSAGNAVLVGDDLVLARIAQNGDRLGLSQSGICGFAVSVSALRSHIVRVVGFRATFQMRWIDAGRIVALVMADNLVRNIFACHFGIHRTVGQKELTAVKDSTVSVPVDSAFPEPTIISFFNALHQAINQRSGFLALLIALVRTVLAAFPITKNIRATSGTDKRVEIHSPILALSPRYLEAIV